MMALPHFDCRFLSDVAHAYAKRRKGLKYDAHSIELVKTIDIVDRVKTERLEITLLTSKSVTNCTLRMYTWPDRWIWIDARQANKTEWAWEFTIEGRLRGDKNPLELIETYKYFYERIQISNTKQIAQEGAHIWGGVLASGPISVKNI